jgi:hypothetical protein
MEHKTHDLLAQNMNLSQLLLSQSSECNALKQQLQDIHELYQQVNQEKKEMESQYQTLMIEKQEREKEQEKEMLKEKEKEREKETDRQQKDIEIQELLQEV